jgi:hypothetical protein
LKKEADSFIQIEDVRENCILKAFLRLVKGLLEAFKKSFGRF